MNSHGESLNNALSLVTTTSSDMLAADFQKGLDQFESASEILDTSVVGEEFLLPVLKMIGDMEERCEIKQSRRAQKMLERGLGG